MNQTLEQQATELRKDILKASYEAGACHIGSALSCVEILLEIFKKKKEKDLFIYAKASCVCAFYSLLSKLGYFIKEKIRFYLKIMM